MTGEILSMDTASGQLGFFGEEEYRDFEEKFKPKKTTDDCYIGQLHRFGS